MYQQCRKENMFANCSPKKRGGPSISARTTPFQRWVQRLGSAIIQYLFSTSSTVELAQTIETLALANQVPGSVVSAWLFGQTQHLLAHNVALHL